MEAAGLSAKPAIFVEFGSGRGQLTYWLTKALDREEEGDSIGKRSEFVLVDRGSQRHKMDNKLKNEFQAGYFLQVEAVFKSVPSPPRTTSSRPPE